MQLILCVLFLIIGYGALLFVLHALFSFVRGGCGKFAPFVVTAGRAKKQMLTFARNRLQQKKAGQLVVDLGSGSGTLLIPLAKEFPQHRFVGYEWDFLPLLWAKWRSHTLKNITWVRKDFMTYDCKEVDVLFCYILKTMSEPLGAKLNREIKSDCLVICELFPLTHLPLVKQIDSSLYGAPIQLYLYQKSQ